MAHVSNVPFVTSQPTQFDIHSNFGMFPGERLLYHCEMKTGCCGLGDHHTTSLTDTRYIGRTKFYVCCGCCCKKPYNDHCIYLRDVARIDEVRTRACCCKFCTEECILCCCCCFMSTKRLRLSGSFGSQLIYISDKETSEFESMITETIAQYKLPNRH
ncbi:unnamed protein product [Rotaria socialis]|uniref:Uncharacterized protein n=1 Tax=Rotaria socialis TaxID=392032 RepID=A0A820PHK6_9BILA|nr:unnamed protein product [Rotaria socialis]CAF3401349.1 unnamed protein product [Rotaria socialis]CAF4404633.1 unnamed protein product [Rotaria socialis]CAF4476205.1 unnamed protein product [Rotaria socialis]